MAEYQKTAELLRRDKGQLEETLIEMKNKSKMEDVIKQTTHMMEGDNSFEDIDRRLEGGIEGGLGGELRELEGGGDM